MPEVARIKRLFDIVIRKLQFGRRVARVVNQHVEPGVSGFDVIGSPLDRINIIETGHDQINLGVGVGFLQLCLGLATFFFVANEQDQIKTTMGQGFCRSQSDTRVGPCYKGKFIGHILACRVVLTKLDPTTKG